MVFDIKNYDDSYVMHCKTEEEAKSFCRHLHDIGKTWRSGMRYDAHTQFDNYKESTCYLFHSNEYGSLEFFKYKGYKILEWSDFMHRCFTKADLWNGDIVMRRNGHVSVVITDVGAMVSATGYSQLCNINDDLTSSYEPEFDIVAVRRPIKSSDCNLLAFKNHNGELVYERKDPVEMTLEEVCKALGKEIKIVPNKN